MSQVISTLMIPLMAWILYIRRILLLFQHRMILILIQKVVSISLGDGLKFFLAIRCFQTERLAFTKRTKVKLGLVMLQQVYQLLLLFLEKLKAFSTLKEIMKPVSTVSNSLSEESHGQQILIMNFFLCGQIIPPLNLLNQGMEIICGAHFSKKVGLK